jgi:hypothetical protein
VVAQRRVSDEEQLSVECYCPTEAEARDVLAAFLGDFRSHMIAYNEQVVLVQQKTLDQVNQRIEERAEEARRLEAHVEELVRRQTALDHPDAPTTEEDPPGADEAG